MRSLSHEKMMVGMSRDRAEAAPGLMTSSSTERGSATVEVAILLPIYVFCLIALLFLGTYHAMDLRILRAVNSFSQRPGEQTNDDLPSEMTTFATGNVSIHTIGPNVVDATQMEIFTPADIFEFMNESAYNATGRYELVDGEIVLVTEVHRSDLGRLLEKYNLFDLKDGVADEMSRTLERSNTSIEFSMAFPFSTPAQGSEGKVELDFDNQDLINLRHEHHNVIRKVSGGNLIIRKTANDIHSPGLPLDPLAEIWGGESPFVGFSQQWEKFREPDYIPESEPPSP